MDKRSLPAVVSIVGGGSLLGREIREVLSGSNLRAQIKLIGADESEAGTLTESGGEPLVITALDEENLGGSKIVMLAGSPASSRKAIEIVSRRSRRPALIDLTSALEDHPDAHLRAPMVEPAGYGVPPGTLHVIAHPAAAALALFLNRVEEHFPVARSMVHIFEPASERGRRGMDELQQQTINLLTFKNVPKTVFDEQLGFNLLAAYGGDAPEALAHFEMRIGRHLAGLLSSGKARMPSIRLIQAPVFHGHSFSVWLEFENNPGPAALEGALGAPGIDVRGAGFEAPTIMGVAGQSGIAVGGIRPDPNEPRACWFWLVADNLRVTADNGVAVARPLLLEEGGAAQ